MKTKVEIFGRSVNVESSKAADRALARLSAPLQVEMELYFSCLIRKAVRFGEDACGAAFSEAGPMLRVGFRPVQTKNCRIGALTNSVVPLADLPLAIPEPFVPKWLKIDYGKKGWAGEFGWV